MALSQAAQAISGLGGIGKTQLAVEYAYRHQADYHAVLWAPAESTQVLTSSCLALAELLNLPEKQEKDQTKVVAAVQQWLRTQTGWLLILDNADDLAVVRSFLPPVYGGHVLLTTRAQAMGRLAQHLQVDTLPAKQGALLLRRAGLLASGTSLDQASPADCRAAEAITRELGGLPLALDQAGAYIEETGCSLADYQQHRMELLKERRGQVPDHPESVATTWSLAFQRIEQAQPAAADLLRLCAFLAHEAIPEEILTGGAPHLGPHLSPVAADAFRLNQAIEALRAYSLLQRDPGTKTLSVHRLVQAFLQDAMSSEESRQWAERAVQAVNAAFPGVEFNTWPTCQRLLPHALACFSLVEQYPLTLPEAAELLTMMGWYLRERGQYAQAEAPLRRALLLREQLLGPEHLDTAQTLSVLAWLYLAQGRYAEAEPLYRRELAINEEQLGLVHPRTATSLNNLATLYDDQGKYEQVEPLYQRAIAIGEKSLGPEHPDLATRLNNLANLYYAQGKYEQAEPLYQRALAILEEQLGDRHSNTLSVRRNYASLLRTLGRAAEAEQVEARGRGQGAEGTQ